MENKNRIIQYIKVLHGPNGCYVSQSSRQEPMSRDELVEVVKRWYDSYCSGATHIDNFDEINIRIIGNEAKAVNDWNDKAQVALAAPATAENPSAVGNTAKLREALERLREWAALDLNENTYIEQKSGNYLKLIKGVLKIANAALAAPPRNCDRFDGDIDKLREACARERGLNPEEDFPDVFQDWLLAPYTEKEGDAK